MISLIQLFFLIVQKLIFTTLAMNDVNLDEVIYLKDGYIHLIKEPESYYF